MTNVNHVIGKVNSGSYAEKCGLLPGDLILSINGEPLIDVFDYRFNILSGKLEIEYQRGDEVRTVVIDKDENADIGIEFENGLMDDYRSCRNKCIFCFIDQMPKGMRETLYFKDDDSRLSFLQGNYVTLTNLSERDIERIIKYRLEPINISFQTMNPELRCKMLNNRFAGESLSIAKRFYDAKITMNGQIVLCKGYNDKDELRYSIEKLMEYAPILESVSVVPVGLTKYREGLTKLEPFTSVEAKEVIETIEHYQNLCMEKFGMHFVHASDEWYINAGLDLPDEETYDGYLQIENGVGMLRSLINEFEDAFKEYAPKGIKKHFVKPFQATVVTGLLAAPYIEKMARMVTSEYRNISLEVVAIRNDFFGENITVSGLLTAGDVIKQLKEHGYKKNILLPQNMLKADEAVFLDDITLSEFANKLDANVNVVAGGGLSMLNSFLGKNE